MIHDPGVRAVLIREPWNLDYQLLVGGSRFRAKGIENGRIVYEECDEAVQHDPILVLSREELEAIAKAILAEERPEDATVDALKDARTTRDRLLAMLEQRGIR
jgi:hypothetical protein